MIDLLKGRISNGKIKFYKDQGFKKIIVKRKVFDEIKNVDIEVLNELLVSSEEYDVLKNFGIDMEVEE